MVFHSNTTICLAGLFARHHNSFLPSFLPFSYYFYFLWFKKNTHTRAYTLSLSLSLSLSLYFYRPIFLNLHSYPSLFVWFLLSFQNCPFPIFYHSIFFILYLLLSFLFFLSFFLIYPFLLCLFSMILSFISSSFLYYWSDIYFFYSCYIPFFSHFRFLFTSLFRFSFTFSLFEHILWGCRIGRLYLLTAYECPEYDPKPSNSKISLGLLGNMGYPFIVITSWSTLNGSTCLGPICRSNIAVEPCANKWQMLKIIVSVKKLELKPFDSAQTNELWLVK